MTLPAMLLYLSSALLYAAVYGGDVVIAMISRGELRHDGSSAGSTVHHTLLPTIDGALLIIRIAAFLSVICFCLTKLPLNGGAYLGVGALLCLVFRAGVPTSAARIFGHPLPLLSIRVVISTIGMFYLIAAGVVR